MLYLCWNIIRAELKPNVVEFLLTRPNAPDHEEATCTEEPSTPSSGNAKGNWYNNTIHRVQFNRATAL